MSELLRDLWYFAATSRELKRGEMFRREILGEPVLLGRDNEGRAFALRDICPHRAVPLSAGRIVADRGVQTVECPYHGWRYGTEDGVCRLIPTLVEGQPYDAGRIRVRRCGRAVVARFSSGWSYECPRSANWCAAAVKRS